MPTCLAELLAYGKLSDGIVAGSSRPCGGVSGATVIKAGSEASRVLEGTGGESMVLRPVIRATSCNSSGGKLVSTAVVSEASDGDQDESSPDNRGNSLAGTARLLHSQRSGP